MNRCTIPYGSSTAKWLATATRSHPTRTSCSPDLRTKWKLFRACQSRGISSTRQHAAQFRSLDASDELLAESAAEFVEPGGDAAAVRNSASGKGKSQTLNPRPSSEVNINPTSIPNVSVTESPTSLSYGGTKSTFKRRPLPLSPLMDPSFLEARQKHHAPKLPPTKTPTSFQQQLAKNPYALALATPVRRCAISGTKLPSFFLQGFRVMSDPTTGDPWYVPTSLANKHLPPKKREALDEVEEVQELEELDELDSGSEKEVSDGVAELEKSEELESSMEAEQKPTSSKMGYQAYTLNSKSLLSGMVDTASGSKRTNRGRAGQAKFVPGGWRGVKSAMQTYGKAGWRPDMDDFVSKLMGRRISEALVYLCGRKRGYLIGCIDWEDALKKPQVAAFLWTGSVEDDRPKGPPEFATLDVGSQDFGGVGPQLGKKKRKVPVYNLLALLGKEKMDELRQSVPKSVFEKEIVVLKHKNVTVDLQSRLWKLQGYMAEHQDHQATRPKSNMEETQADEVTEPSEDLGPLQ